MTTTQSTAKINAYNALSAELVALGASNSEQADLLARWTDMVSGRRPGYYAAHSTIVDEFRATKGLPPVERPGKSAKAAPAPEPTPAPKTAKGKKAAPAKTAPAKSAKTPAKPKAAPAPKAPAREFEHVKNAPGQFCRQRRLVRRTKTVVSVWDLSHADAAKTFGEVLLPGTKDVAAKYLAFCEDHGTKVGTKNYEGGWRAALDPATFCKSCAKASAPAPVAKAS